MNQNATNEQDDDLQCEDLSNFAQIGSAFVNTLNLALDDVGVSMSEHEMLFDIIEDSFYHILRLSSTVTQIKGPAHSLLSHYVENLHKKLKGVAEAIVMADDVVNPTTQQLLAAEKKTLEKVSVIYSSQLAQFKGHRGLTYHSAHFLISLALRVLSPQKIIRLESNLQLDIQLIKIANQLFNPAYNAHFIKDCQLLFSFIKDAPNFSVEEMTRVLCQETEFHYSRIYILSMVFQHVKACDSALQIYLIDQNEKLVFNDKNKDAFNAAISFEPFYKALSTEAHEKLYMSTIHSSIQFCVNRSGLLIPNITHMVLNFGFKLSNQTALALTHELVTKDQIQNSENEVLALFKVVCSKVAQVDVFFKEISGFILSEFSKVKTLASVSPIEKLRLLQLGAACATQHDMASEELASQIVDLILSSKEALGLSQDILNFLKKSSVAVNAEKIQFGQQIRLLTQLGLLNDGSTIMIKLQSMNFDIPANTTNALAMMRYVVDCKMAQSLVNNQQTAKYILNAQSPLNLPLTLKRLNRIDIENHMVTIQALLQLELKPQHQECLESVLIEYLCNEEYVFRGEYLWQCFNSIRCRWSETHLVQILRQVFARVHKTVADKKQKQVEDSKTQDAQPIKQSVGLAKKIRNFLSFVVPRSVTIELGTLVAVMQVLCHPAVSSTETALRVNTDYIVKICKIPWKEMLHQNADALITQFLKERTGILSPDPTVAKIAVNVLGLMGAEGCLHKILPEMMPIFNYKPVEMLEKVENLFIAEFEKISHYDLMFYAEMTRDMLGMYSDKDTKCIKQILNLQNDEPVGTAVEESKASEIQADDDLDPALMAIMAKSSKKKKGKVSKAPTKTEMASKPVVQAKKEAVDEIPKEERNRLDRKQLLHFIEQLRNTKARQIKCCYDILTFVNTSPVASSENYQEVTLAYLTLPLLKLLNLTATRFNSIFFVQNLLNIDKNSPFFRIKGSLLQGLIAVADNKLSNKATEQISKCLHNLNQNANFNEMGVGSLKICLTIANFVLKDPSVNLSVKEIGLIVAQAILLDNNVVQMIDLVRLTVNMLKTNYISHNLSGFLRQLIRRTNKTEIALLLQPLFEYQPVPRKVLLTELNQYDEPLFNPVWFSSQMWILLYDEELGGLARKIWNKFGLALRSECLLISLEKSTHNMYHYLRSDNFSIISLTTKAIGSAMEIYRLSPKLGSIINDLIQFYRSEWQIIKEQARQVAELQEYKSVHQQSLRSDQRMNRIAIAQILERTAKLIQPEHFETVLTFLITESCQDDSDEIKKVSGKAALALIKAQGDKYANQLLTVLDIFLNATEGPQSSANSKNQAVILLGHLAQFLSDTSNKKLVAAYEKLVDLLLKSPHFLQRTICKCIPQLARFFPDKAKQYVQAQLTVLRQSKDEKACIASSFALAGLSKSLGMQYTKEITMLQIIESECFESKKTEPIRKQAGLFLYDALSYVMGHSFEPYLPLVFPSVLSSVADTKEPVRLAALETLKTIMGIFSNYAIKQALPQFLEQLQNDNWRSKLSTVEALGNMAFCAPKQISSYLPQIVKVLREVLNDTHEKVHNAAIEAIKKIGSVIKCPEIGDMLETIIKALANTNTHLNEALNLILETQFAHAIDAPSLSLLVPLLDAGLTMHDNTSKQMAATLMGNICSLTQDAQDLLPYMGILVPAIKNSLFDSIPEIRASASKALGRLSYGLGIEHSQDMLGWLREHMEKPNTSSAEKSGAAQGFAEMISCHGKPYFERHIAEVIKFAQDERTHIRESYRGVLVFLPQCFEHYIDYLSMLVPIMIEGLADDVDEVRKVSMRNVKICIKQFAKTSPNNLVVPVMRMMFSTDWKVRESSSILMFQLVKDLENDVIKATPTYIDQDTKHRILSSMFILKYDPIEKVYGQAAQIWKSLIDNPLMILRQVIDTCIHIIFQIIQSPSVELQEMGLATIRGIVEKMGEKLVCRAIEIFESELNKAVNKNQTVGVCRALFNMASSAPHRLLITISPKLVSILSPYLSADLQELREWSAKVFITLFQRQTEKTFVDPILDNSILIRLKQLTIDKNDAEAELLIQTLIYMVEKAPGLKIEKRMLSLCSVQDKKQPFTIAQAKVLQALAFTFAGKIFTEKFYYAVLLALQEELRAPQIDNEERIQYVLIAYAELIARIPDHEIMQTNEEIERFLEDCKNLNRPGFYLDMLAHYCKYTASNIEKKGEEYMDNILKYINVQSDKLIIKVIAGITAVMERLPKENQMMMVPAIRRQIEMSGVQVVNTLHSLQNAEGNMQQHLYKKKVPVLQIFKTLEGVQSFVNYVQAALMHGSVAIRLDAAFTFKYILEFSEPLTIKKEIIKICGALIRVVNDKFPQDLKMQIYLSLKLIQTRYGDSAKAMAAQLQTTFLKALGDNQTTVHVQKIVLENMILLVKGQPRVDPIIKELISIIEGSKVDGQQKELVSEGLALLIRAKGKNITSTISETVATQLSEIISLNNPQNLNDIVLANCAVALAYLSAYAASSDQMVSLFNTFNGNNCVSVGIKFGVLTNGNETIDKNKMAADLKSLMVSWLKVKSGFDTAPLDEDSMFRFSGAFQLIGHLTNTFGRRDWCQSAGSPYLALMFAAVNESGILPSQTAKSDQSESNFALLTQVLSQVPVNSAQLSADLNEFVKQCLLFVQKFYLDHSSSQCADALLNVLQLTYDNYLSLENIRLFDRQYVKEMTQQAALKTAMSDDMKLYALDIIFKKK